MCPGKMVVDHAEFSLSDMAGADEVAAAHEPQALKPLGIRKAHVELGVQAMA